MYKNPERERLIRLGRAHAHASRSYKPDPYPGTLTLFRAQRQPPMGYGDPQLGWGKLAADIEIQPVPGTHTSLTSEPHVITLAAKLADCIERAARASGEDRLARL
jgi:thioesterase domain-containing protein